MRGELSLESLRLTINSKQVAELLPKKVSLKNMSIQLEFRADWLLEYPTTFEKHLHLDKPICWRNYKVPKLQTPVNSMAAIRTKRLVVALRVTHADGQSEYIATVNIKLAGMHDNGVFLIDSLPLIGLNNVLGALEGII